MTRQGARVNLVFLKQLQRDDNLTACGQYVEIQSCDKPQPPEMESFIQLTGKVTTLSFERLRCISDTEVSGNAGGNGLVLENDIRGNTSVDG
ncbi:hypothetical protein QL093DRAFT_2555813 [Fusarium oxysporum]|nr:hypothetical protein QL093DRAFT_2555813 [Fusarium oxysporum]